MLGNALQPNLLPTFGIGLKWSLFCIIISYMMYAKLKKLELEYVVCIKVLAFLFLCNFFHCCEIFEIFECKFNDFLEKIPILFFKNL